MNKNKHLIILSSPSGGGKSTVARFLLGKYPAIRFSISATTRSMRPGEQNGREYFFLAKEEFEKKIAGKELVEYELIFDNYYGTLHSEIDNALSGGEFLIFDVDVKGALSLKKAYPDEALLIFIAPPSLSALEERLRNRKTESEEQVKKRLERAAMELSLQNFFDFVVINDKLDDTLMRVEAIVKENCGI